MKSAAARRKYPQPIAGSSTRKSSNFFQEVALAPARPEPGRRPACGPAADRSSRATISRTIVLRRVVRAGGLPSGLVVAGRAPDRPVVLFAAPDQLALRQAFMDRAEAANVGRAVIEEDEPPAGRVALSGQAVDGRGQEAIGHVAVFAREAGMSTRAGPRGRPGPKRQTGPASRPQRPSPLWAVGGRQCAGRGGAGRSPPPRRFPGRACPDRSRDRPPTRPARVAGPRRRSKTSSRYSDAEADLPATRRVPSWWAERPRRSRRSRRARRKTDQRPAAGAEQRPLVELTQVALTRFSAGRQQGTVPVKTAVVCRACGGRRRTGWRASASARPRQPARGHGGEKVPHRLRAGLHPGRCPAWRRWRPARRPSSGPPRQDTRPSSETWPDRPTRRSRGYRPA